ncbi:unnamed protein product [Adineta steineri]|uniref:Uncharacterized protein n=2 Tax=Adineta steineri TaxID=433720 RepID=A0A813R5A1_9BILA|nr:unnamed protein product [Adineta steineri]
MGQIITGSPDPFAQHTKFSQGPPYSYMADENAHLLIGPAQSYMTEEQAQIEDQRLKRITRTGLAIKIMFAINKSNRDSTINRFSVVKISKRKELSIVIGEVDQNSTDPNTQHYGNSPHVIIQPDQLETTDDTIKIISIVEENMELAIETMIAVDHQLGNLHRTLKFFLILLFLNFDWPTM